MKKNEVVKDKKLFNYIINKGQKISNEYFIIFYALKEEEKPHFGLAISKKYGNAVKRNKIKRQLRNIIDNNKLLFPKHYNYIIMIKRTYLEEKFKILNESFTKLIRKGENEK